MTQTICRMYPSPEIAAAAADAVKRTGFPASLIHVVAPADAAALPAEEVVAAVAQCGIPKSKAQIYAQGVSRGEGLVIAHAPFTSAEAAIDELAKYQPISSGIPEPAPTPPTPWDEAAPFSAAFQLPTRSSDPTPFSRFWNLPVLINSKAGDPEHLETISFFSRKPGLFSGMWRWPLLSSKATPVSDFFGLSALSKSPTMFSDWLRLPVLIRKGE
ncbi:MAG: hypothetical protein U1E19_07125 [Rhodoblastus sp.]